MIKFKCGSCSSEVELSNDAPTGCPVCGLGRGIQITYPQQPITYPPYVPDQTIPWMQPWPTCPCGCGGWTITCSSTFKVVDTSGIFEKFNTPIDQNGTAGINTARQYESVKS